MEGCGMNCIKYFLVVFNGIFVVLGIVIIASACVDMAMVDGLSAIKTREHDTTTDGVLIAVGVLIIIVAAFGCFGAWKESPKMLYMFVGFMILIFLLELIAGIATAVLRPQIESNIKSDVRASFIKNKSTRDEDVAHRQYWDHVQSDMQCCGVNGPEDYGSSEPHVNPSASCCPVDASSDKSIELQRSECLNQNRFFREGCIDKILDTVHNAGMVVIVCGIVFAFLEVAGIVLALLLAHAIKNQWSSRETA